jgi:hypothetical protein
MSPSSINKQLRQSGLAPDEITIHLKFTEIETQYHCFYCCKGIFRQQGRILNVYLAGEPEQSKIMTVPVSFQCHRCGCIYHVSTISG